MQQAGKAINNLHNGYLIIYVMVLTFITMSIGLSVLSVSSTQYTHVVDDVYRQDAAYGAKACVSIVAERLTEDASFSGFSNQIIFDDLNSSQGRVSCSATISNAAGGAKNVNVTTTMQRFASDPYPISYQVRAVLQASGGSGSGNNDYLNGGILAGHGGLYTMFAGAIATDQINSLGKFYGASGGLSTLGTSAVPIGKITVANIACGDSSNWPQPCTTQPVTQWYGSGFPDIYADTCAPGQTVDVTKFKGVGLSTSCAPPTDTPPGFDKASFAGKMTNTINASTIMNTGPGGCINKVPIIPSFPSYGSNYYGTTVQVPANTRIEGSLASYFDGATNITSSDKLHNGCTFVLAGDTYVTGGIGVPTLIDMNDSTTKDITLVTNGKVAISKDHPSFTPNANGKLLHVISFYSNTPACSNSHTVPSNTVKTCLTNSQAMQSVQVNSSTAIPTDPAITVGGNSWATINLSGATLYAYYGSVHTGCSQLTVAAIGGQAVSSGCFNFGILGFITTSGTNPTFGDLIPSEPPAWRVVDISRL